MSEQNEKTSIVAFVIHSLIFVLMITFYVMDSSLAYNQNYVDMMYIVLGTLATHGGLVAGKASQK